MAKRHTVVGIVKQLLVKYHKKGKIHDATWEVVLPEVQKYFPDSRFNPAHLAWYKHHFLKGDLDELYGVSKMGVER